MADLTTLPSPTVKKETRVLGWEAQLERDLMEGNVREYEQSRDNQPSTNEVPQVFNDWKDIQEPFKPAEPKPLSGSGTALVFTNISENVQSLTTSTLNEVKNTTAEAAKDIFLDLIGSTVLGLGSEKPKTEADVKKEEAKSEYQMTRGRQEQTANIVNQLHDQKEAESNMKLAGDLAAGMSQDVINRKLHLQANLRQGFNAYYANELKRILTEEANPSKAPTSASTNPDRANLTMRQDAVEGQATTHGANASAG